VESVASTDDVVSDDDNDGQIPAKAGLGTNLRPTSGCGPDDNLPASREVEGFLHELEMELLNHLDAMKKNDTRKVDEITKRINNIFEKLRQQRDIVVARTDKTNSIRVMLTSKYIELVENHLRKDAAETDYARLQEVHQKALEKYSRQTAIS